MTGEECPCGHPIGDDYLCVGRYVYGPCSDEHCGGVCEIDKDCTSADCACKQAEEQDV